MAGDEKSGAFFSGFQSWAHLKRFLTAFTVMTFLVVAASILLVKQGVIFESSGLRISFAGESVTQTNPVSQVDFGASGMRYQMRDGSQIVSTLLPANQAWVPTGIEVAPNQIVRIQAAGSVNLSYINMIRRLEQPGEPQIGPYYIVGPDGYNLNASRGAYREGDDLRREVKLYRDARLGEVVGTIQQSTPGMMRSQQEQDAIFVTRRAENGTIAGFRHTGPQSGQLYLSVNDLVVDPTSRSEGIYLFEIDGEGRSLDPAERDRRFALSYNVRPDDAPGITYWRTWATRVWRGARASGHWRFFYDDNAGYYLVTIQVSPPPS